MIVASQRDRSASYLYSLNRQQAVRLRSHIARKFTSSFGYWEALFQEIPGQAICSF